MSCPECSGAHWRLHYAGVLTFQHRAGCSLGQAEDQTHAADVKRLREPFGPDSLDRVPTSTERLLCDHLALPQPDLITIRKVTDTASVTSRTPYTAPVAPAPTVNMIVSDTNETTTEPRPVE